MGYSGILAGGPFAKRVIVASWACLQKVIKCQDISEISQAGKHVLAPGLGLFVAGKSLFSPDSWQLGSDPACYVSMWSFLAWGKLRAHTKFCRIQADFNLLVPRYSNFLTW